MVTIGRIIGAGSRCKIHMAINEVTRCGPAHHRGINPIKQPAGIAQKELCKTCFTPANVTIAQTEITSASHLDAQLDDFFCVTRLRVGYETDAQRAQTFRQFIKRENERMTQLALLV